MKALNNILTGAALMMSVACSGTTKAETSPLNNENTQKTQTGKALVVFFSHAGENYSVGVIDKGNTKWVAEFIQELTGADMFEVEAEKSYDMPYNQLIKVAQDEQRNGEKPAYKGQVPDLSQYDTIYIGTPIWWGTYPQVMFTFFDKNDLNGKTLMPFATHEGSGLGNTINDLKKAYPNATIKSGLAIRGSQAKNSKSQVERWINNNK